jgi:hypothetical protein
VLVTPRGLEVGGEVRGLATVEVDDAEHRVFVAVGVDQHRVRGEGEALWGEHGGVGDLTGGGEVLLEEGGRHRQRFAGVVEAVAIGGIDGEFAGGPEVDAGEVVDGVIVLGVGQAAGEDGAGIAGVTGGLALSQVADPADDGLGLAGCRMLARLLRRHLAGFELVEDHGPARVIGDDAGNGGEGTEIEVGLGLGRAVAVEAVGVEERTDGGVKGAVEGIRRRGACGSRDRKDREQDNQDRDDRGHR